MGELDQYGPIAEFRVKTVADVPVNDEEIVSRTINVIQSEIKRLHLRRVVVLKCRTGNEPGAQGIIHSRIDDMADETSLGHIDLVPIVSQIEDQGRNRFPLRVQPERGLMASKKVPLGRKQDSSRHRASGVEVVIDEITL